MPSNVFLITGNDEILLAERANRLAEQLAGPQADAFSFDVFQETDTLSGAPLLQNLMVSLRTPPFLGGMKTVWLKHFSGFDSSPADDDEADGSDARAGKGGALSTAIAALSALIEKGIPLDIQFIIDGPGVDQRSKFFKICKAHGTVEVFNKPEKRDRNWQAEMAACIQTAASEKGVVLEEDVVDFLIDVLGTDTARISAELEKLICYNGTRTKPITLETAEQVCVGQGEEFSWTFTNAIGSRNLAEALRIIRALTERANDSEADRAMRSLIITTATTFRQFLQLQIFMQQNHLKTAKAVQQFFERAAKEQKQQLADDGFAFAEYNPYRIMKLTEQSLRYKPRELIAAFPILRDALWQCMSSAISPQIALENAITQITSIKQ